MTALCRYAVRIGMLPSLTGTVLHAPKMATNTFRPKKKLATTQPTAKPNEWYAIAVADINSAIQHDVELAINGKYHFIALYYML